MQLQLFAVCWAGLAGFALTSALNLTGLMNWLVRQTTELEVNMNAVERMLEYLSVPPEKAAIIAHNRYAVLVTRALDLGSDCA